jgi:Uma2 family endonuclease
MTAITAVPPLTSPRLTAPQPRRWSKAEYHKMWEMGLFNDWPYIELIDGEIIQMPQAGPPHVVSVDMVQEVLLAIFPRQRYWVRVQAALDMGPDSELGPDVAVVDGPRSSYTTRTPTTALLVVEVSDTTLSIDRGRKSRVYARAGIADYWVVNLNARQLEVHRRPVADATVPEGHRYDEITVLDETATVSPLAAPQAVIRVADLLP